MSQIVDDFVALVSTHWPAYICESEKAIGDGRICRLKLLELIFLYFFIKLGSLIIYTKYIYF